MIRFGTGGWRAEIARDFTEENIRLVAQGLAQYALREGKADKPIVVGRDRRFLSDKAALWISETLAANGLNVLFIARSAPTPLVMHTVMKQELHFGLEVTASHNPSEYNGIKVIVDEGRDAPLEVTLGQDDVPKYLHTASVLDDIPYLFNKEVLLEKIPYMLACSVKEINTGGHAYDWSRGKNFSAAGAMRVYNRDAIGPEVQIPQKSISEKQELIAANIGMLVEEINSHPETFYRILFPPYSLLWWDCAYLNGDLDKNLYCLEQAFEALLPLENVEIYYFQAESDIICNLDNYMDMVHYTPAINQYMLDCMVNGQMRLTAENVREVLEEMRKLTTKISKEEIYRYYPLKQ